MISFDVLTLNKWIDENKDFFINGKISKVQQPTRRELIITIRNNGESKQLYTNIDPKFYHICFSNKKNLEKKGITIPQKPPMFCMQLRKHLECSKISHINQPDNERILEIFIESYNEIGDKIYLCLAIEFMGKHSNIILYNHDTNIIIGCAHNIGADKSKIREIYGAIPYTYPPAQLKQDIRNYKGELDYLNLSSNFYMISKSFENILLHKKQQEIADLIYNTNPTPCISKDKSKYCLFNNLVNNFERVESINEMIDKYYSFHIENNNFNVLKNQYKTLTNQKLQKITNSIKQMQYQLNSDVNNDKYRLFGDLLMANMYSLKDYSETVNVFDYENNIYIDIKLDKLKTIKENANSFYKCYNKTKTAKYKLTELISDATQKKEYLEQIIYSLDTTSNIPEIMEIEDEILESTSKKNKNNKQQKTEILSIKENANTTIYIGKNNKQNDYIISKLANEEDYWFHVHNNAGAHILLKTSELTDDLILKCAKLAKEYSSVKNSSKIGIIYTKRKYIRKPPGANLGYVTYKNEKEIILD